MQKLPLDRLLLAVINGRIRSPGILFRPLFIMSVSAEGVATKPYPSSILSV